jgi:site-specific recombinase XerD
MSEQQLPLGPCDEPDLDQHLGGFLAALAQAGYAEKTQRDKARLIAPFLQWIGASGIGLRDVDDVDRCIDAFLACPARRRYNHRCALQAFIAYLREVEVLPQHAVEPSAATALCEDYLAYLHMQRGLSTHSIAAYSVSARGFIAAMHLPEQAPQVDALAIRHYVLDVSQHHAVATVKLCAAGLRSLLRFCFLQGVIAVDLAIAVPPVGHWQCKPMPALLTDEAVEHVLAVAADRPSKRGCRDFAILQLLARLGLRASEVLALRLEDIDWNNGEILVHGKGDQLDRLPLLQEVGASIAQYLCRARGANDSRSLFLSHRAPRIGLQTPSTVSAIARCALQRAGLLPSGRVGAHIFRYSLATRMLRHGASLTEIAQVLRHRSIDTTQGYAKVDLDGLRCIAQAWPGREVRQ